MKIVPLFDRILTKEVREETTTSGIYVPASQGERSQIMTVVSTGDGICEDGTFIKMKLTSGDKVLVSRYAGVELNHDGEKFYIFRQSDILALIDDKNLTKT